MAYPKLKRLFDVLCAGVGLAVLFPLGVLLALVIKLSDGGPIFYRQVRVGRFGKPFRILKFRSMVVNADRLGLPLTKGEDGRITRIGRLLRRTKLDELPQLWNVLVGEMSFVGPRPEVPKYVERYSPEQRQILQLRPGITDMASMLFRNEAELLRGTGDVEGFYLRYCLPKKIELNLAYAERANVVQDIWIILQTLCPYWVGVLVMYGLGLVASLWMAYQLRFDFQLDASGYRRLLSFLPWIVLPQLVLLFWRGELRGLLSYFSLREMKRTASALAIALALDVALGQFSSGRFAPRLSILLLDFLLSLCALVGIRMGLRLVREHYARIRPHSTVSPWRVAIIGTGDLATRLALDLRTAGSEPREVVAFFDDDPHMWNKSPHGIPVVGMPECLLNGEWSQKLDEVIVALPGNESTRVRQIAEMLKDARVKVSSVTTWPILQPLEV